MPGKPGDADFRAVAEVVTELARHRGADFDTHAWAMTIASATQADPTFKAQVAELARRIVARRNTEMPRELLASLKPFVREFEDTLARITRQET